MRLIRGRKILAGNLNRLVAMEAPWIFQWSECEGILDAHQAEMSAARFLLVKIRIDFTFGLPII